MVFEAAIFDMDGVITDTAAVHASAWKSMFDDFLRQRSERAGTPFFPFTADDYHTYVDGRPRYDGVAAFLAARDIALDFGDPSEAPGDGTVCGLGNRKDAAFNEILVRDGVTVFPSTLDFIAALQARKVKLGVATSSKNGAKVLAMAGITNLFEAHVDGVVSAEMGLWGKPAPDIFAVACERLGVARHKTLIVEDAVSGVAAGARGRFGLTIGIDRHGDGEALKHHGADMVVHDLSELSLASIDHWFSQFVRTQPGTGICNSTGTTPS